MRIERRTSGLWQTNSVVLSDARQVLVVDPAYFPREVEELAALVRSRGSDVTVVFTHGHWDHVAGWPYFERATVLGSAVLADGIREDRPAARRSLEQLRGFDSRWYVTRPVPPAWPRHLRVLGEGDRFGVGGVGLEVLELPGHSADSLGLLQGGERLLIAGDYLSPCEIPLVEDLEAYRATLARLRALLPELRLIVPGHGPELDAARALAILEADAAYLDALADCAALGDREAALAIPWPRAADVPGMAEWHLKNCEAAGLGDGSALQPKA
ncbi:MAG TPA: MBL fold metallo-hydrolase [Vicinamibacteria bacterium]|nr:MBL fold metallo-hydrolase [Vicinamibacteria bacterium]